VAPLTKTRQRSARRLLPLAAVLLCAILSARAIPSQENAMMEARRTPTEYEVKAAFLLNFVKFVEWPDSKRNGPAPLSICILGDDPFGAALDQIVQGERINGRPLVVKRLKKWRDSCDAAFISRSEKDIPEVLQQIGPRVLTVGESSDFLTSGGMINFVLEDRRVRFDVNRGAAERGSVRISSRLLSIARAVLK